MKMIITDLMGYALEIENPKFIPREGERIEWSKYYPCPTVQKVLYNFETNLIVVTVK